MAKEDRVAKIDKTATGDVKGGQAIGQYLASLVKSGKITTDDVDFLIDSGALKN